VTEKSDLGIKLVRFMSPRLNILCTSSANQVPYNTVHRPGNGLAANLAD